MSCQWHNQTICSSFPTTDSCQKGRTNPQTSISMWHFQRPRRKISIYCDVSSNGTSASRLLLLPQKAFCVCQSVSITKHCDIYADRRHIKAASSPLTDLLPGTRFKPVLSDPVASPELVQRIVFLSGKIYYDLVKQRQSLGLNDRIAFVRIEELSPFPFHQLRDTLQAYTSAKQFLWLQEEPKNQGAWAHVASRLNTVLAGLGHHTGVVYNGRMEASLPAPGVASVYAGQQKEILAVVFRDL